MSQVMTLSDELNAARTSKFGRLELPVLTDFVKKNINQDIGVRPYQNEALCRLIYYIGEYQDRQKPTHLLFNMATGSGKTLIMAASMLYLYEKGYRNFVFFVNSTSIIEKTRDNFLNDASSKYLFSANKQVRIQEVPNFQVTDKDGINILFTTVQGLHGWITTQNENSISEEDFEEDKVVLLADEAHHINALTKSKLEKTEAEEKQSWEGTVTKIFNMNIDNILLEFTATIDMSDKNIAAKYSDKLIYKYTLKEFRKDKYSKDVEILSADSDPIERAFNALVLSQYRLKIAERNGLFIKPTILMKSKDIKASLAFEEVFHKFIINLSKQQFEDAKARGQDVSILKRAFDFFEKNNIDLDDLAEEFKEAFGEEKTISVNSKNDSEAKQLIVNSLEDSKNQVRIVFAVDKLNEGWDVLNLFDIVRLYETRDGKNGKPGKTTMAEAQLIGRGARYCPFAKNGEDKYTRKYDNDLTNDLRTLEELYYHSQQDSRYISELKIALIETGMQDDNRVTRELKIKDSFKETDFWKHGLIFLNEKRENPRDDIFGLDEKVIGNQIFNYTLKSGLSRSISIFDDEETNSSVDTKDKMFALKSFGSHIVRKAMQRNSFYLFNNLKKFFPNVSSVSEFIESDYYLGSISVDITGPVDKLEALTADEKLHIAIDVLASIENSILANDIEWRGTEEFKPHSISKVFDDRIFSTTSDNEKSRGMADNLNDELKLNLSNKEWYVHTENYGTDQEKLLVRFINNYVDQLKQAFQEVYLLRNEKDFKIHAFDDGAAFEPDFVLFLKSVNDDHLTTYQLFIEPKGEHLIKADEWKEKFLKDIEKKHKPLVEFENKDFKLVGLPFFNKGARDIEFRDEFLIQTKL